LVNAKYSPHNNNKTGVAKMEKMIFTIKILFKISLGFAIYEFVENGRAKNS
jgi:hypothetical protein